MSSDKNTSAIEFCAGEVRWRKDGLLEQLWRINHIGPTGAVEKTTEEWRLVPELEEPAPDGPPPSPSNKQITRAP